MLLVWLTSIQFRGVDRIVFAAERIPSLDSSCGAFPIEWVPLFPGGEAKAR